MQIDKIKETVVLLARELNSSNIKWSLGASMMLYLRGVNTTVDDIDVIVDSSDVDKLLLFLEKYPYTYMKSNPKYQTKHFYQLVLNGIDVDIMVDFRVQTPLGLYIYPFHIEDTVTIRETKVHLASLEKWQKAYKAMGRETKVQLIESFLQFNIPTKRCIIAPIKYKDFDDLYDYLKLEEVHIYENSTAFNKEKMNESLEWLIRSRRFLGVRLKENMKIIGHIYFSLTTPPHFKEYSLGYMFHPNYHNKGYCTETTRALLDYAFKNLDIHRVKANCNPENIASWRVMEKIGLLREGRLKGRVHFKNDSEGNPIWWDEFVYGITKENWQ